MFLLHMRGARRKELNLLAVMISIGVYGVWFQVLFKQRLEHRSDLPSARRGRDIRARGSTRKVTATGEAALW